MHILVTGGAGYIGSHTTVQLLEAGHSAVIVDDFSNSKPSVLERIHKIAGQAVPTHALDVSDADALDAVFEAEGFDAVIHFAGLKAVGESTQRPLDYYRTNLTSTFSLVRAMARHRVGRLVFSSSATVYGPSDRVPLHEDAPTSATSPYGWTKVMNEQVLRDVAAANPEMRVALLRYFNPVGAHGSGLLGEDPQGIPNNLVPYIAQVAVGRRRRLQVFGGDYSTYDGTGLRDYIHVEDLAAGHLAALERLRTTGRPLSVWNLGTGRPTSVLEMLRAFEAACGRELPFEIVERRPGDAAVSFADPHAAEVELGWRATRTVEQMCADHWNWQQRNPNGYPAEGPPVGPREPMETR